MDVKIRKAKMKWSQGIWASKRKEAKLWQGFKHQENRNDKAREGGGKLTLF